MAIDTEMKRRSAIMVKSPFRHTMPVPSGTVDDPARATVAFHYSGFDYLPLADTDVGGSGDLTLQLGLGGC